MTREENMLITNKSGLIKSSHSVPGILYNCAVLTELDIDRQFKNANWEAIRQKLLDLRVRKTVPDIL